MSLTDHGGRTMRTNNLKDKSKAALRVVGILSFAAVAAFGQQVVNMTAAPTSLTLPDGSTVPMWGYSCGTVVVGSTAKCAALNPAPTGWSPVVITVPTGQTLQIKLTNSLTFTGGPIPTSLTDRKSTRLNSSHLGISYAVF